MRLEPETGDHRSPRSWVHHLAPSVDPAAVDLLVDVSLPRAWAARWREAPDRLVLRDREGSWLTAGALAVRTAAFARRLQAGGLVRGDRVLLAGPTSVAVVVAHVALLRAGLVVVPVNPSCAPRELRGIVADAGPAAALLADEHLRQWTAELAPSALVADLDLTGWPVGSDRADARGREDGSPAGWVDGLDDAAPDDVAILPYTSGTTGAPKGVPLSHANLLASAAALRLAWRWSADDRLILCLPLFHMHGMGVGLHGTLLAGGSAVMHDGFDPELVLADAAGGATLFFGVPTMYARLADTPGIERLAALRLCVAGSAPLSAELHERIRAASGQVVLERYGMTETVMLASNPVDGERRAGTVGFPLPGVDLRLATSGEIEVRGPNVFAGYLGRPDTNEAAFTTDGWFRTGDIGEVDAHGYVSIVGRSKELIISGGYNVYPREVEEVLRGHPAVVDAAVAGTPSEEWGEIVTAYVVATDDLDVEELLAWIAGQVTHYKRPRLVHRVADLPRNSLGKVVRHELRPPD
jgi:malonyl-CoA/methylmalonyl-CoA synthetase